MGQTVAACPSWILYEGQKCAFKVGAKVRDSSTRIYRIDNLAFDYFVPTWVRRRPTTFGQYVPWFHAEGVRNQSIGEVVEGLVRNDLIAKPPRACSSIATPYCTTWTKSGRHGLDPRNAMDLFTLLLGYHVTNYK